MAGNGVASTGELARLYRTEPDLEGGRLCVWYASLSSRELIVTPLHLGDANTFEEPRLLLGRALLELCWNSVEDCLIGDPSASS